MEEQILNRIYGFLYREYDGLHQNVDTDGQNIFVDIDGDTYAITVVKCEKEAQMYTMKEYYSGRKRWAVYTPKGELLCVCLYKKGATCLVAHLNEVTHAVKEVEND